MYLFASKDHKVTFERDIRFSYCKIYQTKRLTEQENIPVGCVPPASMAITRCQYQWRWVYQGVYQVIPTQPLVYPLLTPGKPTLPGRGLVPGILTPLPPKVGLGIPPPVDRHTPVKTLPSRNFVGR